MKMAFAKFLQGSAGRMFGRIKANSERVVTPRIRKLVASVSNKHQLHT
jgi:hypothetical protein